MDTRPLLAGFVLAGAVLATPLAAQTTSATRTLPVTGSVPQVCALQPATLQPGDLVNINGVDGDTLRILELTDPQTLAAKAASATVSFAAVCNFPHRVTIESQNNGLWPTDGRMATPGTDFASALPYEARVDWADTSGTLYANAKVRALTDEQLTIDSAAAGNLILRFRMQQGASNVADNAPVLAGVYGDTIRIFLEPR